MAAYLFALLVYFTPNPYATERSAPHFAVPLAYSVAAWEAARAYDLLEPEDLVANLIVENASREPYPTDRTGKDGEVGLMQVMAAERRAYNRDTDADHTQDELRDDWRLNVSVAAHAYEDMKQDHGLPKPRCKGRTHPWIAHVRCGNKVRDEKYCWGRRDRLRRHFAQYTHIARAFAWLDTGDEG